MSNSPLGGQRATNRSVAAWSFRLAVGIALAYGVVVALLARLTAKVILRPPRWRIEECWPGLPFADDAGTPADLPRWLCQTPRGLLVVEASADDIAEQAASTLCPGDMIRSIDGIPTAPASARRLAELLRSKSASQLVRMVVERPEGGRIKIDSPLAAAVRTPSDLGLPYEEFSAGCSGDRSVRGWYIPPPQRARRAPALVFFHGRQTNRRHVGLTDLATRAHARGYAVLLLDLFGSGETEGDVDFWSTEEARVAVEFLRCRSAIDPERIGLVGVSFGGMKAMLAGTDAAVRSGAVVVLSMADTTPNHIRLMVAPRELPPFIRARLLRGLSLPRWLVESGRPMVQYWIRRDTGRCLSEIQPDRIATRLRCPVFVAHGVDDRTFCPERARRIFAAIPAPKVFHSVLGHDHFTTAQSGEPLWRHVFAFLDEHLVSPVVVETAEFSRSNNTSVVMSRSLGPEDAALPAAD